MVTIEQLQQLGASSFNSQKYIDGINETLDQFEINTPARICQFLAQCFHESGNLATITENLNYSAQRLMQVWPARYPNITIANQFAHNPQAIANKNYGGRGGNNNDQDGWLFSGKGLIQLTFKSTYKKCGDAIGVDLISNPEALLDPRFASLSAGWFWNQGSGIDLNTLADLDSDDGFNNITKRINGALGNIEQRRVLWSEAKDIFV